MRGGYKGRAAFVVFLFLVAYFIILYAIYTITIVQRDFFLALGQNQYKTTMTIVPDRGTIYDRNGKTLALNKDGLAAFITPAQVKDPKALEKFLTAHFPGVVTRWHTHPTAHFLYVARRLTPEQVEIIKASKNKDIYFLQEPLRLYPVPSAVSLVGATDVDNHGISGVELIKDGELQGEATTVSLERDARSGHYYFARQLQKQGKKGDDVALTIDADLQFLVAEELKDHLQKIGGQEGAAVVLDPATGDVHAMVSCVRSEESNYEHHTKAMPLTDVYELGSVMKTVVALGVLQEKLVDLDECIDCKNSKMAYVQGVKITTWKAHGLLTLPEIIQSSNNIGIATVALRLGSLLYDHYRRLGFGSKTAIPWPGQQSGFVNPPDNWSKLSIISLSFGYEVTASILQLVQAFSIIAMNGVVMDMRLFADQPLALPKRVYDAEVIEILKSILERTVSQGTAHKAKLQGYRVMGKTGTANMVIDGKYNMEHNIYTFAGIVEKGDYRRVIVTFVKDVGRGDVYASTVAAPLFERIAQVVVIHDKVVKMYEPSY